MRKMYVMAILLIGFAGLTMESGSARAQSIFLEPNNTAAIHLEALRPGIQGVNYTNLSFAFFLSGRVRVGDNLQIRTEFPYITYNYDYLGYYTDENGNPYPRPSAKSGFGNPYLGLDFGNPDEGFQGEAGVRIPLVDGYDEGALTGALTDPVERLEAFSANVLPIYLGANYRLRTSNGFGMRVRLVPVFWMYTGDSSNSDNDLFFLYSAQAWYEDEKVGVGGGFSGRLLATGDVTGLGERTLHQFGFFANYTFGRVMPGFQVRFPLDSDLKDSDPYEYLFGLGTNYSISIGVKL